MMLMVLLGAWKMRKGGTVGVECGVVHDTYHASTAVELVEQLAAAL